MTPEFIRVVKKKANEFEDGKLAGKECTEFIQWLVDHNAVKVAGPDFEFITEFFMSLGLVKEKSVVTMQ